MTNTIPPSTRPPRRIPLGQSLDWSSEDIERLAEITPADIQAAKTRWQEVAGRRFRKLLDARAVEGKPE